jgi:hypothetical protein
MSSKSSELTTMRAMLVGAALTGLIAGTSTAASAAGANDPGQVAAAAGEKSRAKCVSSCIRVCIIIR